MITAFMASWSATGRAEGGFSDNPHDSGGPTNHGITEVVARAHGFKGDMRDLPAERATEIAKAQYWDAMKLDDVAAISPLLAKELFDTGFNAGQGTAARFLQDGLNAFNRSHNAIPDYPEVTIDGNIGAMTLHSLKLFFEKRGSDGILVLLRYLNCRQGCYYDELRKRRSKDEEFMFGWFLTRVVI
jgi:lysozyme family protein